MPLHHAEMVAPRVAEAGVDAVRLLIRLLREPGPARGELGMRGAAVVHGEEEQSLAFAETLRTTLRPGAEVTVPVRGQVIEF